jgi:hypothetical protein
MPASFTWPFVDEGVSNLTEDTTTRAPELLPRDILSDADGDIGTDADGDLGIAYGLQAVKQDVEAALGHWVNEWFADLDSGTDYPGLVIGVKGPDLLAIRAMLRKRILDRPGIGELTQFDMAFNPATRQLEVDWRATSALDEISSTVTVQVPT